MKEENILLPPPLPPVNPDAPALWHRLEILGLIRGFYEDFIFPRSLSLRLDDDGCTTQKTMSARNCITNNNSIKKMRIWSLKDSCCPAAELTYDVASREHNSAGCRFCIFTTVYGKLNPKIKWLHKLFQFSDTTYFLVFANNDCTVIHEEGFAFISCSNILSFQLALSA